MIFPHHYFQFCEIDDNSTLLFRCCLDVPLCGSMFGPRANGGLSDTGHVPFSDPCFAGDPKQRVRDRGMFSPSFFCSDSLEVFSLQCHNMLRKSYGTKQSSNVTVSGIRM